MLLVKEDIDLNSSRSIDALRQCYGKSSDLSTLLVLVNESWLYESCHNNSPSVRDCIYYVM